MNPKQLIVTALASAFALPFVTNVPAKAYSCGQLLVGMEDAYDLFQAAELKGDERTMLKSYLAFEAMVDQAKSQGCMN